MRMKQVNLAKLDLKSLSIEELWALHEEIATTLSDKIMIEKRGLEERLARLKGGRVEKATTTRVPLTAPERRKYPPVLPKFQNPSNPSETWAGRGKQPRWLVSQIKAGKKINDFLINRSNRQTAAKRRSA
jgi:DNA-binding protein H-NS